jgi:hypothetical protein
VLENRREIKRQTATKHMPVYDFGTGQPLGYLVNLSPAGAMFVTQEPVKPSSTFRCRLQLADSIMGYDDICFDAECRWCRKNIAADRWESGYRIRLSGIDKYLVQFVSLGFELCNWGDDSIQDVATVEMTNRRKSTRFEVDNPLPVYELKGYRQLGTLMDLSTSGARLVTHKIIRIDDLLHCRVRLPKKIFRRDYLTLNLKCVRCRKLKGGTLYDSGFTIESTSREDTAIILHLLLHYARKQDCEKKIILAR